MNLNHLLRVCRTNSKKVFLILISLNLLFNFIQYTLTSSTSWCLKFELWEQVLMFTLLCTIPCIIHIFVVLQMIDGQGEVVTLQVKKIFSILKHIDIWIIGLIWSTVILFYPYKTTAYFFEKILIGNLTEVEIVITIGFLKFINSIKYIIFLFVLYPVGVVYLKQDVGNGCIQKIKQTFSIIRMNLANYVIKTSKYMVCMIFLIEACNIIQLHYFQVWGYYNIRTAIFVLKSILIPYMFFSMCKIVNDMQCRGGL